MEPITYGPYEQIDDHSSPRVWAPPSSPISGAIDWSTPQSVRIRQSRRAELWQPSPTPRTVATGPLWNPPPAVIAAASIAGRSNTIPPHSALAEELDFEIVSGAASPLSWTVTHDDIPIDEFNESVSDGYNDYAASDNDCMISWDLDDADFSAPEEYHECRQTNDEAEDNLVNPAPTARVASQEHLQQDSSRLLELSESGFEHTSTALEKIEKRLERIDRNVQDLRQQRSEALQRSSATARTPTQSFGVRPDFTAPIRDTRGDAARASRAQRTGVLPVPTYPGGDLWADATAEERLDREARRRHLERQRTELIRRRWGGGEADAVPSAEHVEDVARPLAAAAASVARRTPATRPATDAARPQPDRRRLRGPQRWVSDFAEIALVIALLTVSLHLWPSSR